MIRVSSACLIRLNTARKFLLLLLIKPKSTWRTVIVEPLLSYIFNRSATLGSHEAVSYIIVKLVHSKFFTKSTAIWASDSWVGYKLTSCPVGSCVNLVSMYGTSLASQILPTCLDDVSDSGPKTAATPTYETPFDLLIWILGVLWMAASIPATYCTAPATLETHFPLVFL